MRLRFFVLVLLTLILTTASVSYIHVYFFRNERLRLIDSQIRKSASILLTSELNDLNRFDLEEADDIISEELGDDRIGKIFLIRNEKNELLYASRHAQVLDVELPQAPQWVTIHTAEHFIRMLNLELPKRNRTLQVGVVMDPNFLSWSIIDERVLAYIAALVLLIFVIAGALTLVLLTPIRKLVTQMKVREALLGKASPLERLSPTLLRFTRGVGAKTDEFAALVAAVQSFLDRLNHSHKLTRAWSLQMAHELKTPLTLIRAEIEALEKKQHIPSDSAQFLSEEIQRVSTVVNQFLDWADLESATVPGKLHAIRVGSLCERLNDRLDRIFPNRLRLQIEEDCTVLANPLHIEQLLNNLITNSLKFSPEDRDIRIRLAARTLSIRDQGAGIPSEVIERLGQPFNRGQNVGCSPLRGSGLGLAWASTVARLYKWDLRLQSGSHGTEVSVHFAEQA